MMSSNYFSISLSSTNFSIIETVSKQKKRHNALDTLEKIEKVLRENLYSSTFPADHPLYQMEEADSIRFLQTKATEIHTGYVKKQSKLCWLWRKIFSKKKRLDAVYKRIANFTLPTNDALPIHNDCIPHVLQFLPMADLWIFGQLNRHAKAHADLALSNLARKLGYKGKKIGRGKAYLKNLHHNLHFISQYKWAYGVDKTLFNNLTVRNHQGKILVEESLDLLKQLSIDDLARLFANDLPLRHLKKAILNPLISTGETFTELTKANLALYLAVRNKEFEVVQFLLTHGANANLRFEDIGGLVATPPDETLLSLSIKQKTHVITHLLLQAKANIDPGILHVAAKIPNNQKAIQLLLKFGAGTKRLDNKRNPAIFAAIKSKSLANVQALIKGGCEIQQTNDDGKTSLQFAVTHGTPKIIKILVEHGADPYKTKLKWRNPSPFFSAIVKNNLAQVLAFIEGGADLSKAWDVAADYGTPEIIKLLLKHHADPNVCISPLLLHTIKHKKVANATALIDGGVDVHYADKSGKTALHIAAKYGTPEIIKLLLKHGADPYKYDKWGNSPLECAMRRKNIDQVHAFIEGGLDLNSADKDGQTALHRAVMHGTSEVITLLIQHGAGTNHADNKGRTPLHLAAERKSSEIIPLLLQHGADPYQCDTSEETPFFIAVRHQTNLLAFIEAEVDLNYTNKLGQTILHFAAKWGDCEIISLLIKHGVGLNCADQNGQTALHFAAARYKTEAINLLIQHGADPYILDKQGYSPLMVAIEKANSENVFTFLEKECFSKADAQAALRFAIKCNESAIIELLLQHKIDLNYADKDGQTALHVAAKYNRPKIIKLFIKYGADVYKCDNSDMTPLFVAIKSKQFENVNTFVEEKVDLTYTNKAGQTALHIAAAARDEDRLAMAITELLIKQGVDLYQCDHLGMTPFFVAIASNDLNQMGTFAEFGIDLNHITADGTTALHVAAKTRYCSVIGGLISEGANPYQCDHSGQPPFFSAIEHQHSLKRFEEDRVLSFIKAGIDLNYTDKDGQTALHIAVKHGKPEIVELLIKHGANPQLKDNNGLTPFDVILND